MVLKEVSAMSGHPVIFEESVKPQMTPKRQQSSSKLLHEGRRAQPGA